MSVQSESGRIDYHKSSTGPQTRMAGDVVKHPMSGSSAGAQAQGKNEETLHKAGLGLGSIDYTNLDMLPGLLQRYEDTKGKR